MSVGLSRGTMVAQTLYKEIVLCRGLRSSKHCDCVTALPWAIGMANPCFMAADDAVIARLCTV